MPTPYAGSVTEDLVRLKAFPRYRVIERELFTCRAGEMGLIEALGAPTSEVDPPLGAGNPRMFWDVELSCGLVMGLHFDRITEVLTGHLDLPEVGHSLRHLNLVPQQLWLLEKAEPEVFAASCAPVDHHFRLWESTTDDEPLLLAAHLSHRDAECLLASLQRDPRGPKRWIELDPVRVEVGEVDCHVGLMNELTELDG